MVALWALTFPARAQFGGEGDMPVEITADGNTRFEEGVAIAENNVQIHYGDYSIFCDYAEYNPETKDVMLVGNIRLYAPNEVITGERVLFNFENKKMQALELAGSKSPFFFKAFSLHAPSTQEIHIRDAMGTSDDSSMPAYYVKARSIRIYPDSRVIFIGSTLYVKDVPVFWFPYLWANTDGLGFEFVPGYDGRWGVFGLCSYSFPLSDEVVAKVHADYRSTQGQAFGFDLKFDYGKAKRSYGNLRTYVTFDKAQDFLTNRFQRENPAVQEAVPYDIMRQPSHKNIDQRYRVDFQHRLFLTDDIYATADIVLLSDSRMMLDFFPNENTINPRPDNNLSLTKWSPFYTLTLLQRWQVNEFIETTERKPELALDFKQHRIFGLPVYYEGSTSVGSMRRAFSKLMSPPGEPFYPDYNVIRADSFHQFSLPTQLFGWLNITPRAGFRATYYSKTGNFYRDEPDMLATDFYGNPGGLRGNVDPMRMTGFANNPSADLMSDNAKIRPIVNFGVEATTKVSRTFEKVQSRFFGLDGLRHVAEPYANFSYVNNLGVSPEEILQMDRLVPTTRPLPLTFSEFGMIDSLDSWAITRVGMRNRLQTRRDSRTYQMLSTDTFLDINIVNPYTDNSVSNLYNSFKFRPLRWFQLDVTQQIPLQSDSFNEWGIGFSWMPSDFLSFRLNSRYLNNHPDFSDQSQLAFTAYYRMNENWAVSFYEQYETFTKTWQYQRYMVHRDVSNWIASVGFQVREDNENKNDYGVVFSLSLKDAPQVTLPFQFSMGQSAIDPSSSD